MKIKTLIIAASILAISSPAFATNLGRCENLDPLVSANPNIIVTKYSTANAHISGSPKCGPFVPAGVRACPDVGPGGSLSTPVTPTEVRKVSTPVPDTVTPQYREGEVNVRATATATIAATIANGYYTYVEVVNWDAAQVGSCS